MEKCNGHVPVLAGHQITESTLHYSEVSANPDRFDSDFFDEELGVQREILALVRTGK